MKTELILTAFLFALSLSSCYDETTNKSCTSLFIAKVEFITAPDTIYYHDSLKIIIKGTLGSLGCDELEKYETYIMSNAYSITVWGKDIGCQPCLGVSSGFNDTLTVFPHNTGNFYILVHQPNGGITESTVYVK
jgi:hypothetical protein